MRVFVLTTGRAGSTTIAAAFGHATNFTAAHESRIRLAAGRLDYPDQHIEADPRLAWFTGSLTKRYPDAFIVHLTRPGDAMAASLRKRFRDTWTPWGRMRADIVRSVTQDRQLSIIDGFAHSVLMRHELWRGEEVDDVLDLYKQTVDDNIDLLKRHHEHATIDLETVEDDFRAVWFRIGAEGDLDAAIGELSVKHNASIG